MSESSDRSYATTEEPDVLIGHYIGEVTEADIRRMLAVQKEFSANRTHLFLVIDLHRVTNLTSEARRAASAEPPDPSVPTHGTAVVGASFHLRVMMTMFFRAAKLLGRVSDFPVRFFDDMAPARRWFDERRRELGLRR